MSNTIVPEARPRPAALIALALFLLTSAALSWSGEGPQEPKRGAGTWDPESGLGNHRVVIRVEAPAPPAVPLPKKRSAQAAAAPAIAKPAVVQVRIPWRRRDLEPEKKNIIVVDASTGQRITNVLPLAVTGEIGYLLFEPQTVPGDYYVYFMPYRSEGRKNYPNIKYDLPEATGDPGWLDAAKAVLVRDEYAIGQVPMADVPSAEVVEIQSADEFSAFTPMELVATAPETKALLAAHPAAPYLLFPEDRTLSIRMADFLPYRWAVAGPAGVVTGRAARGEYFTFQVGVWAARAALSDLEVRFSDLALGQAVIPAKDLTCFNGGGTDWDGSPIVKAVPVEKGKVQALWCGVRIPRSIPPGTFKGTMTVVPAGLPETILAVEIAVTEEVLEDAGDSDPFRMSRLRWLDSTLAQDNEIVPPFTPLTIDGMTIGCLGRSLTVGPDGFPARIRSYFAQEMTRLSTKAVAVTPYPIKLIVRDGRGSELNWTPAGPAPRPTRKGPGAVVWEAESAAGDLRMKLSARMEFDGFVDYKVAVTALRDMDVSDIMLDVPFSDNCARYMMGLGVKGGPTIGTVFEWTWDQKNNQDALWLGSVNAGMQVSLRAENYSRPLNTNFYLSKPLAMPPSWWNEGRGAVRLGKTSGTTHMEASSGPRTIRAGEALHFDFTLLITPFKTIDPPAHFRERYYHAFTPLDEVAATGANVINVHHANAVNPYINYPFLRVAEMKAYVDDAHGRGFKVKIYDTIRELSNRAPELFALRSLGHEIFSPGPGGGYSWLQEHLGSDYIAAWFVPELKDAAVINSGMSRWHNYYIEGLDWVARNVGIDGLYLDDVAFDRTTMKRVRKVLDRRRPGALIDLHSANQYNVRDGFASSANLYLEHFPFLNRLWFGEYFDYNGSGPDYWLVEMSGIPFGLMGEMLQDGGNPWRGMVFGMTSRLPWAGDPRPLWKVWDEFGITESEMIGWWVDGNPVRPRDVKSADPWNGWFPDRRFLATSYVRRADGKGGRPSVLIALASWAEEPVNVRLMIDWKKLGLDPKTAVLTAPAIDKFQDAAEFKPGDQVRIEPGKGWLLILR